MIRNLSYIPNVNQQQQKTAQPDILDPAVYKLFRNPILDWEIIPETLHFPD